MNADRIIDAGHAMYHGAIVRKLEREIAEAREQSDRLVEALRQIKSELGVPQPEYPAPIANAVKIADEALASVKGGTDE